MVCPQPAELDSRAVQSIEKLLHSKFIYGNDFELNKDARNMMKRMRERVRVRVVQCVCVRERERERDPRHDFTFTLALVVK